jgi:hypothetical protein
MLRNILLTLTGVALVACLLGCQSEEGVTGPVTLQEDSGALWGYTYQHDGLSVHAFVQATDLGDGGDAPFWYGQSELEPSTNKWRYDISGLKMKYREGHTILIEAYTTYPLYLYGYTEIVYEDPPVQADVYME